MLIAIADLLEAEGRSLRHWTLKIGIALSLVILMGVLALSGITFLGVAVYIFFSDLWGNVAGALMMSLTSFIAAGIVLWTAARMNR